MPEPELVEQVIDIRDIPAKYDVTEAQLQQIKELSSLEIEGPRDEEGIKKVGKAYDAVRALRIDIEKRRKELKAPALEYGRAVDAEAKRLSAQVEPVEENLSGKITKVEREQAALKEAKKRENIEALLDAGFEFDGHLYMMANLRIAPDEIGEADEEQVAVWIKSAQEEQERIEKAKAEADARIKAAEEAEARAAAAEKKAAEAEARIKAAEEAEQRMKDEAAAREKKAAEEAAEKEQAEQTPVKPAEPEAPKPEGQPDKKTHNPEPPKSGSGLKVENDPLGLEGPTEAEKEIAQQTADAAAKSPDYYRGFNACKSAAVEAVKDPEIKKRGDLVKAIQKLKG